MYKKAICEEELKIELVRRQVVLLATHTQQNGVSEIFDIEIVRRLTKVAKLM
jgi:hypothetical protein